MVLGMMNDVQFIVRSENYLRRNMLERIYELPGAQSIKGSSGETITRFREEPVHYLVNSFRLNQFPVELRRFWADNYQPYRASVFVAGRHLAGEPGEIEPFEIVVSGRYRWVPLTGPHGLRIDGQRRSGAPDRGLGRQAKITRIFAATCFSSNYTKRSGICAVSGLSP